MALDLEKAKKQRDEFIDKFSPDKLENLNGKDLLLNVFPNLQNGSTMADMISTGTSDWVNVNGGSQAHWKLFENKKTGKDQEPGWKSVEGHISDEDAKNRAEEIKEEILKIAQYIRGVVNSPIDYDGVYDEIADISNKNKYVKIENSRYLKYFALVYPGVFPLFYDENWLDLIIKNYIKTDHNLKKLGIADRLKIIAKHMKSKGKDSLEGAIEYANDVLEKGYQEKWGLNYTIEIDDTVNIGNDEKEKIEAGLRDIYRTALDKNKMKIEDWNLLDSSFVKRLRDEILPNLDYKRERKGKEGKPTEYARYLSYFIDDSCREEEKEEDPRKNNADNNGNNGGEKPNFPLNQILYGPPGTGKTYNTIDKTIEIIKGEKVSHDEALKLYRNDYKEQIEFVTFHQSYGYEEFIQGIKPSVGDNGQVIYKVEDGIFKKFCDEANKEENNKKKYVFIIDEINRGNVSKIFGELITLIEEGKRISAKDSNQGMTVKLPYKDENGEDVVFGVPDNVYILGTMNTADRSLVQLDAALRRRFRFIEMMPNPKLLSAQNKKNNQTGVDLEKLLKAINERICALIDREHQIGHSYFMKVESLKDLRDTFQYEIIPLLQEYFYDDYENILQVLNNQLIKVDSKKLGDVDYKTYTINAKGANAGEFTAIYGDSNSKTEN